MILIAGGNSALGRRIISKLQHFISKDELTLSVRDLHKAHDLIASGFKVRQADYANREALLEAFSGIKQLLFISGTAPVSERIQQHKNVIDAAKQSRIQHVFYTSFIDVNENSPFEFSITHAKTESFIKQSNLNYTILRNNLYADFLENFTADANNCISFPAGDGKAAFISREDIANFAVNTLLQPKYHKNKTYHLTGSKSYSWFDIAEILSMKNNKTISYIPSTPEEFVCKLIQSGKPEWISRAVASMYVAMRDSNLGYATVSSDFEKVVGHPTKDIRHFII